MAHLTEHSRPAHQLLADLSALNEFQRSNPLSDPYLAGWLRWAIALLRPRSEVVRFEQWYRRVTQSLAAPHHRRVGVPSRPEKCIGRDEMLSHLFALLQQRPAIVSVVGRSGSGKTTIARQFLARLDEVPGQSPFDLIVWLSVFSASTRGLDVEYDSIYGSAPEQDTIYGADAEQDTVDRLRHALADALGYNHLRASDGRQVDEALVPLVRAIPTLVVLDDVEVSDSLRSFLGTVPVSALLTCTNEELDFHHVLPVGRLPDSVLASIAMPEDAANTMSLEAVETPLDAILAGLSEDAIESIKHPIPNDPAARAALGVLSIFRRPPSRDMLEHVFGDDQKTLAPGLETLIELHLAEEVANVRRNEATWIDVPTRVRSSWESTVTEGEREAIRKRFFGAFSEYFWGVLGPDDRERFFWHRGLRLDLVGKVGPRLADILHAVELGLSFTPIEAIDLGIGIIHVVWEMGWPHKRIALAKKLISALDEHTDSSDCEQPLPESRIPRASALAWCFFDGLGWAHAQLGDIAQARKAIEKGFRLAEEREKRLGRETLTLNFARYRLGDFQRVCGEFKAAERALQACWNQDQFQEVRGASARALGRLYLMQQKRIEAAKWFDSCYHLEASASPGVRRRYAARAQIDLAHMLIDSGDFDRAKAAFDHAHLLAGDAPLALRTRARAALGLGRLFRLTGRELEALRKLEESTWLYRQVGGPTHLALVEWERSQLGPVGPISEPRS